MVLDVAIVVLTLVSFLSESYPVKGSPSTQTISPSESEHNEKAVLRYVWPALKAAGKSGRIYYPAVCQGNENVSPVAFPAIEVLPPRANKYGLLAVRDIFRANKDVIVREDGRGTVRVWIGNVSDAILHTRISSQIFDITSQYNLGIAVEAIKEGAEVQTEMRKLGLSTPMKFYDVLVVQPAEGRQHLPSAITDVTMDQALDMVATTFKGIVLYGACVRQRRFDITFVGGIYADDRWFNTDSAPR